MFSSIGKKKTPNLAFFTFFFPPHQITTIKMKFFKKSYIGVIFCLLATVDANIIVKLSSSSTIGSFFHRYPQIMRHVGQVYSFGDFIGFSGNFNLNVIRALQHNPFVKSIVPDTQVMTTEEMELRGADGEEEEVVVLEVQRNAPRHLARIQQRQRLQVTGRR